MSETTKIKIGFERDPTGTRAIQNDLSALNALAERLAKNFERIAKSISSISNGGKQGFSSFERIPNQSLKGQGALLNGIFGSGDYGAAQRGSNNVNKALDSVTKKFEETERKTTASSRRIRQNIGGILSGGGYGGAQYNPSGGAVYNWAPGAEPAAPAAAKIAQWRVNSAGALVGGAFGSLFGGQGGVIGAALGGLSGGGGPLGGVASRVAPFMGGIAAGAGIAAMYNKGAEAFESLRAGRVDWTLNKPFMKQQLGVDASSPNLAAWQAIQGKDAGYIRSFHRVLANPEMMRSLNNVSLQKEKLVLATKESPVSLSGMSARAKDILHGMAGGAFQSVGETITGANLSEAETGTLMDIARKAAYYSAPKEQAQKILQATQNDMARDPLHAMLATKVYGNALGRVKMMRAAGMSTGIGPKGSKVEAFEADLLRGGWTPEDYAAGRSQMLGVGAGYMKALGPIGAISAGIGGLTNAAELVKAGGMLGGSVGAAKGFYRSVQGSIGRGGLDVAVGRDYFGGATQSLLRTGQMGAGDTASTYLRSTAGLIAGGMGAPNDVAQQQRLMNALAGGVDNYAAFTTGAKAPLYQATSLLGSIGAMGGYSTASEGLSSMRPEVVAGIMRGGEVPAWAKAIGIDREAVTSFGNYQRKAPFFEVMDQGLEGTRAGDLMSQIRGYESGGGSYVDLFKSETGGLKGKKKAQKITQLASELSGVLYSQGLAASPEEAMGTLLAPLSQDKELAPFLKGKGVGAASPKGSEKIALEEQAKSLSFHAEEIAKSVKDLEKTFKEMAAAEKGNLLAIQQAGKLSETDDLDTIAQATAASLMTYAAAIKLRTGDKIPVQAKPKKDESSNSPYLDGIMPIM